MRTLFFICFTILSTVLIAQDQSDPIIAEQINQQVWEPFKEAYATSDGPMYVAVHADDVLRITKWGIKQNPAFSNDILRNFSRKERRSMLIDFQFEHRIHSDSIGYEVGYYEVSGTNEKGEAWSDYGRFNVVLKKKKGLWKIAQDWDSNNINGVPVTVADFNRLDSLAISKKKLLNQLSLKNNSPKILKKEANEIQQYWEIKNHPALWEKYLGETPGLSTYKKELQEKLGDKLFWETIEKERKQNPDIISDRLDNYNYQLTHKGEAGSIRPISFLEAELLNYQLERYPLIEKPTEFHGFITQNDSLDLVRIYIAASDQPFPPKPRSVRTHMENSLTKGWKLTRHLHNHYEPADNNYLGAMAPSKADAHYFKMLRDDYGLGEILITNGFTTLVIKPTEIDLFESH